MSKPLRVAVSCVTENKPGWFEKTQNLVLSVRTFGGTLAEAPLVVCVVDDCDPHFRDSLERLGSTVRVVPAVDPIIRYANKLRMFEVDDLDCDVLLALDCDTVVVGDPSRYLVPDGLGLKPVDRNYLSREQWRRLYEGVGLALPSPRFRTTTDWEPIHPYFNSGVISVPVEQAQPLAQLWHGFISRLGGVFEHDTDLARWRPYSDQFALSCAILEGGFNVSPLPVAMNFPTHVRVARSLVTATSDPLIIHYHSDIDERGFLLRGRYEVLNRRLDRFNRSRAHAFSIEYRGLKAPPAGTRMRRFLADRRFLRGPAAERIRRGGREILARARRFLAVRG